MTSLDWLIIGFALLMALWGYVQGVIVGALSLAGFAAGAVLGSRIGPLVLEEGSRSPYAPLGALVGALLVGGLIASVLEVLGFRLRGRLGERLGLLDGLGGAVLVGALGLALAWVLGAVALQTPVAALRAPIQRSAILTELNTVLPPSGPLLRALARFDPFPRIEGPAPGVRRPDPAVARDPEVRGAEPSVVKVLGTACGLGVEGSGWVAGDGVIVTNAHAVAGQDDTTVQLGGDPPRIDADVSFFDPDNDLAILQASGASGAPPLELAQAPPAGTAGAILGFPENGPYDVVPGRLGETRTITSQDAYGRGPVQRSISPLRGLVRPGNSGGPVVDGQGRVLTTVFAASVADGGRTGYGVPNAIVARAIERAAGAAPVDTGPCAR
ncbi:MAG: MarP family serine protease [Thermoleophilaceae bacterium]